MNRANMSLEVLLEAPFDPIRRQMNSVLLTIDLTKAVADEAIERKDCVVVAYRTDTHRR
jgi:putative NIF3 family GTP cyclohydrolase 1 type 2